MGQEKYIFGRQKINPTKFRGSFFVFHLAKIRYVVRHIAVVSKILFLIFYYVYEKVQKHFYHLQKVQTQTRKIQLRY